MSVPQRACPSKEKSTIERHLGWLWDQLPSHDPLTFAGFHLDRWKERCGRLASLPLPALQCMKQAAKNFETVAHAKATKAASDSWRK